MLQEPCPPVCWQKDSQFFNMFDSGIRGSKVAGNTTDETFKRDMITTKETSVLSWSEPSMSLGWNFEWMPTNCECEKTLEELAEEHLTLHESSKQKTLEVSPKNNTYMAGNDDSRMEMAEDRDMELLVQGREDSLTIKDPSSFAHVLCAHKVRTENKNTARNGIEIRFFCPPEIRVFDFLSPSPDDIVIESQKRNKKMA